MMLPEDELFPGILHLTGVSICHTSNSINYVPAWSSDLKRTQSMAGGMLLTYAYLHALMCRRIPTACSQL
ncbi:unnamed protein product [Schistosoma curassoni]|nr:unnamed protein product [Schistosoma curassoni]